MQMISFGGEGKSLVLQALHHAEEGQFAVSLEKLQMARDSINKGRQAHANILDAIINCLFRRVVPQPPLKTAAPQPISTSTIVPTISAKYFFIVVLI